MSRGKWALALAVVVVLLGLANPCPAQAQSKKTDDLTKVREWLEAQGAPGRMTVGEWIGETDKYRRTVIVWGFMNGEVAGFNMCRWRSEEQRRELLYLFEGWKMSPSDYVLEVDVLLEKEPVIAKTKSVTACFVRAEAAFARTAGQEQRALRLERAALMIELISSLETSKTAALGPGTDRPKQWHTLKGLGGTEIFARGFLEGMALVRFSILAGADPKNVASGFRVGQLQDEVDSQVIALQDEQPVLLAFLKAEAALVERARVGGG